MGQGGSAALHLGVVIADRFRARRRPQVGVSVAVREAGVSVRTRAAVPRYAALLHDNHRSTFKTVIFFFKKIFKG